MHVRVYGRKMCVLYVFALILFGGYFVLACGSLKSNMCASVWAFARINYSFNVYINFAYVYACACFRARVQISVYVCTGDCMHMRINYHLYECACICVCVNACMHVRVCKFV